MPLIKIELEKGRSREFLISLMDVVMSCVQQQLQLPTDDRNIRLTEVERGFFHMKKPYSMIIEISMFSGRSLATKRALYHSIVSTLSQQLGVNAEEVFILINEQPKDNWGIRGGIPASEADLGFTVEV